MKPRTHPHPTSDIRHPTFSKAITTPLLRWYAREKRSLPWRHNPTPYRVWVSEVMLQQTRVEVVAPRYLRFLARFPDLRSLAESREEEVLAEWSGLGYYRRARALHAAARSVMERHGGDFPRDLEAARRLPGVGRYTAGAVLSIAMNLPVPILDGNIHRVLTRLGRIGGDPRRGATERLLWEIAEEILPRRRASVFNQALMELGATVCLPQNPRCGECPLSPRCESRRAGDPERFPERDEKRPTEEVRLAAAVIEQGGRYLLERRGDSGPRYLRGLWSFPTEEMPPEKKPRRRGVSTSVETIPPPLAERLERVLGIPPGGSELLGEVRHAITFRRIQLRAYLIPIPGAPRSIASLDAEGTEWEWGRLEELGAERAASSLALKVRRLVKNRPLPTSDLRLPTFP